MTSELTVRQEGTLTREQIDLIKHTVAVGATDNELQLFLYQAKKRGLDPLTRQIYFIKRKQYNPDTEKYEEVGTIQTGIDGFRVVADRTGKLAGIKRGAIKDDKGKLTGAWAEVYRSDWSQVAREEVSFNEYCQKKKDGSLIRLWATMPETMIKKVAEAAALRMAFPEDLSGIYSHEEMQQADSEILPIKVQPKKLAPPAQPAPPVQQPAPAPPVASEGQGGIIPPKETEKPASPQILANGLNVVDVRQMLRDTQWLPKDLNIWLNEKFKPVQFKVTRDDLKDLGQLTYNGVSLFLLALKERQESQ